MVKRLARSTSPAWTGTRLLDLLAGFTSAVQTYLPAASFTYGPINAAQITDGTLTERTYRTEHTALVSGSGVHLRFLNSYSNPITLRVGFEPTLLAAPVEVTFGGVAEVTIPAHGLVLSDPVAGVTLTNGAKVATRTRVGVTSGQKWMIGERNFGGAGRGGHADGDLHLTGTITSSNVYLFGPVEIAVTAPTTAVPKNVGVVMDSLGGGWPVNAFEGTYPTAFMSRNGESAQTFLNTNGSWGYASARTDEVHAALADYSNVVEGYGTNDRASGRTPAQVKADRLNIWKGLRLAVPGIRVIAATQAPRTTSTDGWATTSNQTPIAGEANRIDINTWLRAGAPIDGTTLAVAAVGAAGAIVAGHADHPLHSIFELADVVEPTRDAGVWIVGSTTDGIHPGNGAAGRAAIGTAFPVASLAAPEPSAGYPPVYPATY